MTKRDIYYREPELFKRQSIVDHYIDEIAYTFGVERLALNVVAAAKGLMAGSLTIIQHGCPAIDYSFATEGILIPNWRGIEDIILHDVFWILVIEKEASH